ncbi:MAG: UDP-glucose 4-epimerase GalE [Chloroflexota bacterium]
MTILVTGGAGYVGSHTVHYMIEKGYDIVVFDNLYMGHREAVHEKAAFVQGDLLNRDDVAGVFRDYPDIDGIVHFASHTMVGESMQKPWLYLRDNITAASNLLEFATENDVKRFVFSSTANLFDEPESMPIRADNKIIPGSPYGESKAMIERLLHWMDVIHDLKWCGLRYFNAAGAHPDGVIGEDHTPETHLIPLTFQVALGQREQLTIFGDDYDTPDGTCVRDYVHVLDLAQAHVLALEAIKDGRSRQYNLGTGNGYSIRQLVDTAQQVSGKEIKHVIGDRRPGDPATLIADSTAIKEELGWAPQFDSLEKILETAWQWHSAHPEGYGS